MEEILDKLKQEFEGLEYEKREFYPYVMDSKGDITQSNEKEIRYFITQVGGNDNVTIKIEKEDDVDNLKTFISKNLIIFNDFVGVKVEDSAEVMLSPVSRFFSTRYRNLEENPILVEIYFKGAEFQLEIGAIKEDSILGYFVENMIEVRRRARFSVIIKKVGGGKFTLSEQYVRELLFSTLFDIEYSYEIALDTIKYENSSMRRMVRRRSSPELPDEPIKLVYKRYIPELIEYLHTAEKVDYLPFKYICYFHIIEYFMDKSAYRVAAKKVKALMLKPDFHIKSNHYVSEAINIFKKENDRYQTDAIKLNRVFREFIELAEIRGFLSDSKLDEHFDSEVILESQKNFVIPKIKFDNESEFYSSLSKRIYSLRCSIVHSNPDFDENKAIPFTPTESNLFHLRKEMELIKEISKTIVAKSIE